jgi:L-ascorbate metabolism protein UlaG (beta-lactamase superfamily)
MKSSHINPEEAVKVFEDLDAKYAIAVHWGTFKLTLEKMDEPPRKLEQALENSGVSKTRFRVLQHGESWPEVFIGAKT